MTRLRLATNAFDRWQRWQRRMAHGGVRRAMRYARCGVGGVVVASLAGCGSLIPAAEPQPAFYTLDRALPPRAAAASADRLDTSALPLLVVNLPHAAAGFDSAKIIYFRRAHQLEYYAHSEWVDTPARMLAPLLVAALAPFAQAPATRAGDQPAIGWFSAVVAAPTAVAADLTLETDLLRLQQDFGTQPSRVRFTVRVHLIDSATRQVLASREYDRTADSASEDAAGGVDAAHRVVDQVLAEVARWCSAAAAQWRPADRRHGAALTRHAAACDARNAC
jgi:cholesterol transport system auxiliary component